MRYQNIKRGFFIERPNRFVAHVEVEGKMEVCHVKNTGRCKELLTDRAKVLLQESSHPGRKTKYDLISVWKAEQLINIDSQAPNTIFREWLSMDTCLPDLKTIKPEQKYGNSRFDFYLETEKRKIFVEVKGVTLEQDRVARFPDAPTDRGVKHLKELAKCIEEGYEAMVVFIIQMKGIQYMEPNDKMHPEFGGALRELYHKGAKVLAIDCLVTENEIIPESLVQVRLD